MRPSGPFPPEGQGSIRWFCSVLFCWNPQVPGWAQMGTDGLLRSKEGKGLYSTASRSHSYDWNHVPRVSRLHHIPSASATPDNACFFFFFFLMPASRIEQAPDWLPCHASAQNGSRLHDLFLLHRAAPPGPSPERDTALAGLQCTPDVAPRAWQPPERDLFCGLSKVEGCL